LTRNVAYTTACSSQAAKRVDVNVVVMHIIYFKIIEQYILVVIMFMKAASYVLLFKINVPTDIDGMDLMAEKVDRKQLVDLLKHMLMLDQERRIKPDEALNHPFQTMSHLLDYFHCTTYDNISLLMSHF